MFVISAAALTVATLLWHGPALKQAVLYVLARARPPPEGPRPVPR